MNTKEKTGRVLSKLLVKVGEIQENEVPTKQDIDAILIRVFKANAEAYDQYQNVVDSAYDMESQMYRSMAGDERSESQVIADGQTEAKKSLRKALCYIVKWGVGAGFYSDAKDLVKSLYDAEDVAHMSARDEYYFWRSGCEITPEKEYEIFLNRFLKVTGFTCKMFDFKYLMS